MQDTKEHVQSVDKPRRCWGPYQGFSLLLSEGSGNSLFQTVGRNDPEKLGGQGVCNIIFKIQFQGPIP